MKRKLQEISSSSFTTSSKNDVYSRASTTNKKGRGCLSGWTTCPLCNSHNSNCNSSIDTTGTSRKDATKNVKKFSLGRGISMHLQQVHTPWKPGKAELARRERLRRRLKGLVYHKFKHNSSSNNRSVSANNAVDDNSFSNLPVVKNGETEEEYYERVLQLKLGKIWNRHKNGISINWDPTKEEIDEWAKQVITLTKKVEMEAKSTFEHNDDEQKGNIKFNCETSVDSQLVVPVVENNLTFIKAGNDRLGFEAKNYKDSLPPFIMAASKGDLSFLKESIQKCEQKYSDDNTKCTEIMNIIDMRDRNGSTAVHWAAGGGHLKCLQFIFDIRAQYMPTSTGNTVESESTKRKRDGKTCLHYAARNGHDEIIDYLIHQSSSCSQYNACQLAHIVDVQSNDGTTPLHLACYGGHPSTIKSLITKHKADFLLVNEWGCGIGHWIAMSITDTKKLFECLDFIKECIITKNSQLENRNHGTTTSFSIFGLIQKHGHSAVHKAAQKLNYSMVEWIITEAKEYWTDEQIHTAGQVDTNGNKPSEILIAMGGDVKFAGKMHEFGW